MGLNKAVKGTRLWEYRNGRAHYLLGASIHENGDLVIYGSDVGPFVEEAWGTDEYEYDIGVTAELVGDLLLALLKDGFGEGGKWAGGKTSEFMAWMKTREIPYSFGTWM